VDGGEQHYAMGWNVNTVDGIPIVYHAGDTGHFNSTITLMPDRNAGFVLLANASGFEESDLLAQVSVGLFSLLNGKSPAPISVPFMNRFLYWAILLTPLLQVLGILLVWRKRQSIRGWRVFLIVILNLAVVFILLGFSQLIPFPLASMLVFFPELGYSLIAITILGIGWSVAYTVMYLRMRRTK
jgi:hypothetical protein